MIALAVDDRRRVAVVRAALAVARAELGASTTRLQVAWRKRHGRLAIASCAYLGTSELAREIVASWHWGQSR